MFHLAVTIVIRLTLCSLVAYFLWRLQGAVGLAVVAPLFGIALARPAIDVFSELKAAGRALAFASIEGRHFEFRGTPLDIAEDDSHRRWLLLADVRNIIPALPRDGVLETQFPGQLRRDLHVRGPRIHAESLVAYLKHSTEPNSLRFRHWLEREVVYPAAMHRQRLGIVERGSRAPDA